MVREHPGKHFFIMDVAVPISAYPELIAYVEQIKAERSITAYMIGHAGDGNVHSTFMIEPGSFHGTRTKDGTPPAEMAWSMGSMTS